jgi:hypothetical protein
MSEAPPIELNFDVRNTVDAVNVLLTVAQSIRDQAGLNDGSAVAMLMCAAVVVALKSDENTTADDMADAARAAFDGITGKMEREH